MSRIVITGLGNLGGEVLYTLARTSGIKEIIATDIDEKKESKVRNAIHGSATLGLYPKIQFRTLDLNNIEVTSEFLRETSPDLIFNTSCLQPFWKFEEDLPKTMAYKITEASSVGFCSALPWRIILPYKLMQAVKKSKIKTHVLITNDPCEVINPMLEKVGLAPTTGIGDFAHAIQPIRRIVSYKLNVPMLSVKVYLIAHHSILHLFQRNIIPSDSTYFLKVMVEDKDITKEWKPSEILLAAVGGARTQEGRFRVPFDYYYTASLAVGDMLAILNDTGEIRHCPGPSGHLGGYPVRLDAKGAEVFLPEGISLKEAVKMHQESQKYEGIDEVREDGTVILTDQAVKTLEEALPWDIKKQWHVTDCEKIAEEYDHTYKEFIAKFKKQD